MEKVGKWCLAYVWQILGFARRRSLSHLRAYVVLLYAFVYNGLCVYNVYKLILR